MMMIHTRCLPLVVQLKQRPYPFCSFKSQVREYQTVVVLDKSVLEKKIRFTKWRGVEKLIIYTKGQLNNRNVCQWSSGE